MAIKKQLKCSKYICAFIIPAILLLIIFLCLGVTPFGNKTLLISDMKDQYVDYFSYYKTVLRGENDALYTFSKNLGGDMAGLNSYYLMSPFNLLLLLFSAGSMPLAITLIIWLKLSLCGVTFYHFLNRLYPNAKCKLLFSTTYALMAYNMSYCFDVMWLDCVMILPLIIWGLHKILSEKKPFTYIFSLSYALIVNYYIGYMLCIFSVLYFVCQLFIVAEHRRKIKTYKKQIFMFIGASLAAAGIAAFTLIPTFLSLQGGRASFDNGSLVPYFNFNPIELFTKLYTDAFNWSQIPSGLPNIFCGILMICLSALYFMNKSVPKREKWFYGGLLGVIALSFMINTLNIIWHGFSAPIWFPYRYSFLFSFIMICISFRGIALHQDGIRPKHLLFCSVGFLILSIVVLLLGHDFIKPGLVLLDILLALAFCMLIYYMVSQKKAQTALIAVLITVFQFANLCVNGILSISDLQKAASTTTTDYVSYVDWIGAVVEDVKTMDDGFYRMEKTFRRTLNDSMQFSYNGLTHFSSSEKNFVKDFMGSIGYCNAMLWAAYNKGTTASAESLLGLKYILADAKGTRKHYDFIRNTEGIGVYQNPYALLMGFGVSGAANMVELEGNNNPFDVLNSIYKSMVSESLPNIFTKATYGEPSFGNAELKYQAEHNHIYLLDNAQKGTITYTIEIQSEDDLYIFVEAPYRQDADLYVNGEFISSYMDYSNWSALCLGSFTPGEKIEVMLEFESEVFYLGDAHFYHENLDTLGAYVNILEQDACNLEKIKSSHLKGQATIGEKSQYLLLSIPYEDAWKIYVDGKLVQAEMLFDALIGVPMETGTHMVEMRYEPAGLKVGCIISAITVTGLLAYCLVIRKKRKKALNTANESI